MIRSRTLAALGIACIALSATPLIEGCHTTQPAREQMSDAAITTKVKSKFVADPEVSALNITVDTEEGVVYLTGRVKTETEKREAEELARRTDGVKRVVNNLMVGDKTP
jgi:hyperosmotically inducible periplasmic protein